VLAPQSDGLHLSPCRAHGSQVSSRHPDGLAG
jgi:hypothetical protein